MRNERLFGQGLTCVLPLPLSRKKLFSYLLHIRSFNPNPSSAFPSIASKKLNLHVQYLKADISWHYIIIIIIVRHLFYLHYDCTIKCLSVHWYDCHLETGQVQIADDRKGSSFIFKGLVAGLIPWISSVQNIQEEMWNSAAVGHVNKALNIYQLNCLPGAAKWSQTA